MVHGNLIIGEGVGDGNVTLNNVSIKGDTIVKGGGMNSIIIENSQITNLIIEKKDGKIRILAKGTTYVSNVEMNSSGKLESADKDGSNFGYVVIAENIASTEPIILKGNFENVDIKSGTNDIKIESGTIKNLVIATTAKDTKIDLAEGVTVDKVEVNAKTKVEGKGKVGTAEINAKDVDFKVEADKQTGTEKAKDTTQAPSGSGGGGAGSSDGGGESSGGPVTPAVSNQTVSFEAPEYVNSLPSPWTIKGEAVNIVSEKASSGSHSLRIGENSHAILPINIDRTMEAAEISVKLNPSAYNPGSYDAGYVSFGSLSVLQTGKANWAGFVNFQLQKPYGQTFKPEHRTIALGSPNPETRGGYGKVIGYWEPTGYHTITMRWDWKLDKFTVTVNLPSGKVVTYEESLYGTTSMSHIYLYGAHSTRDKTHYAWYDDLKFPVAAQTYAVAPTVAIADTGTVKDNTNAGPYKNGTKVNVTASPNPGYEFVNWTVNGVEVSKNTSFDYITTAANTNLVANFKKNAKVDQAAPVGLVGLAPTSAANDDGKITGTTTEMEYKLSTASDWVRVTGTEVTALIPGTYAVRYAAKTGFNAGSAADVEVAAYLAPASTDASVIGVAVKDAVARVDGADARIYNVELAAGTKLSELLASDLVVTARDPKARVGSPATTNNGLTWTVLVTAEDGITTETYTIKVAVAEPAPDADQAAPVGLVGLAPTSAANDDGKITGTTTEMEYKLSTASDWVPVTGTQIPGLAAGSYQVRYAAKTGYNAGSTADVEVAAYDPTSPDDPIFTPGEGGAITFTPFVADDNKIGGLYIEKNHDYYSIIFERRPIYYHSIEMKFLPPNHFGATGYKLQSSEDLGNNWTDYINSVGEVVVISQNQDNVLVSNPGSTRMYRLVVSGGPKDGYTSNTVTAELLPIKTKFSAWSLDESMHISGIMYPWSGRGLEASFTAVHQNYPEENTTYVDEYMSYQWYRVNPVSYEMSAIPGATNLTYITSDDDIGYNLLIRATGDEEHISGFIQIMTKGVVAQNNAYVDEITATGFTLNLHKSISGLRASDLILTDYNGSPVVINGVTQGDHGAIYNVSASLDPANGPFYLENNSEFWKITTARGQGHITPGVGILYGEAARSVTLEVPKEAMSPYHIDVIVLNAATSEPITGLVKEDFVIRFGETGYYLIDMIGQGGMEELDGGYTLFPNQDMVECPIMGSVRIPVGKYTLEFSKTGYQDASIPFEISLDPNIDNYDSIYVGDNNVELLISLWYDTFKDATSVANLDNWEIDTGTTNLKVEKIVMNNETDASISFTGVAEEGDIRIQAKATSLKRGLDSLVLTKTVLAALSNDASLTSLIGTVDHEAATIVGVPSGTALADFKGAITPAAGGNFEVYEADGVSVAIDLQNHYQVIVTAEDGRKKTYTVTVDLAPAELIKVDIEVILEEEEEIWISVFKIPELEERVYIEELTQEDFSLSNESGDVAFRFEDPDLRDPYIPDKEKLISPLEAEVFSGTYTLTFAKNGYESVSKQITIPKKTLIIPVNLIELGGLADRITISLVKIVDKEPSLIDSLVAEDFILIRGFGDTDSTVIDGFRLDKDPLGGTFEYDILPPDGEAFAAGKYRLGFSKEGYNTAHIDFTIEANE